jgi:hypothetical protein
LLFVAGIASGACRTIGYVMFIFSGVVAANKWSIPSMLVCVAIGHICVCAAEVLSEDTDA